MQFISHLCGTGGFPSQIHCHGKKGRFLPKQQSFITGVGQQYPLQIISFAKAIKVRFNFPFFKDWKVALNWKIYITLGKYFII